jgi:hypothetical protein
MWASMPGAAPWKSVPPLKHGTELREAQFVEPGKFGYLWVEKIFSYRNRSSSGCVHRYGAISRRSVSTHFSHISRKLTFAIDPLKPTP